MAETIEPIREWLHQLAARIAPAMTPEEISGRIAVLAEDLTEEYSESVFCRSSMLFVAKQCRFWPNLAELVEQLSAWRKSQNPYPVYGEAAGSGRHLEAPRPDWKRLDFRPAPTGAQNDEQREWARETVRTVAEQLAALGEAKRETQGARPKALPLTPTQLIEAYKRDGARGPVVQPEADVVPMRAAATPVRPEVRRGPMIDGEPPDA